MFYLLIFNENYADECDVPALAVMDEQEFEHWCSRLVDEDSFHDYFGNLMEDSFQMLEDFNGKPNAELIEEGVVKVTEVPRSFVEIFNDAGLASLSMCNIFK